MDFIKEIIQSEWIHLKELQDKLALYQADLAGVDNKAVEILNSLIDDYYVCLGQLEALPKETIKTTVIQPEKEIEVIPEVKSEPIVISPINAATVSPEIEKTITIDPIKPQIELPLGVTKTGSDLINNSVNLISNISEDDMWNCDFGDPVGPKLTDADLYEN